MQSATEGFLKTAPRGLAVGVLPQGKPGNGLTPQIVITTRLPGGDPRGPASRNHVNVAVARCVIALPGTGGTIAEMELASEVYRAPMLAVCDQAARDAWPGWCDVVERCGVHYTADPVVIDSFLLSNLDRASL